MEADVSLSSTLAADDILTFAIVLSFPLTRHQGKSPMTSKLDF